jgi:hypothetical protein
MVTSQDYRQIPPVMRGAATIAVCVLVALGIAYYFTYEPAPRIGVRWRTGLGADRRSQLERRFLLVDPSPTEDMVKYDLLDTRRENLNAIVSDPDVAEVESIHNGLPVDYSYGERWMWMRHRVPILRARGVVEGIVLVCVALLAVAVRMATSERPRSTTP